MSHSNGIISAPISISDPYIVTGTGKYNGGYDLGYICSNKHGKINKWSLRKPVPGAPYGQSVLNPTVSDWYIGGNGKCGLDIYTSNSMQGMADYVLSTPENNRWGYTPPRGGDSEPFRLSDFNGYRQDAIKPLYLMSGYEGAYPSGASNYPRLRLYYKYNMMAPSLFISDPVINDTPLMEWFLAGIIVNSKTGNVLCGGCNQYQLGYPEDLDFSFQTDEDPMVIPLLAEAGGIESLVEYTLIPVLSKKKKSLVFKPSDVGSDDLFCDLPVSNSRILAYAIKDVGCYTTQNSAYWNNYGVHYNILGENKTSQAVDLGGFTVELWSYDPDDKNITFKVIDLDWSDQSWIPANSVDYEIRVGGAYAWDSKVNMATAYDPGYFIKLIGDDPKIFPNYRSQKLSDER